MLVASRTLVALMRWLGRKQAPKSSRQVHLTATAVAASGYLFFLWIVQQVEPSAPVLERPLRGLTAVALAAALILVLDGVTGKLAQPPRGCEDCGEENPNRAKHCMRCGAPLD